ncbi:hypothetical protein [Paraburkholderia youngii]|uniref:hypothetical protein n=1 Tax=Paraburkholderia youngii TaxID=2782701 RepID=UPI003D216DB5
MESDTPLSVTLSSAQLGHTPDPRERSPVCLALTARDVVRTQEDLDALYAHLVEYNLYIYTKLHLPTRSFRIGCMGCIDPMWIRLLGIAFEDFFQLHSDESGSHAGPPYNRLMEKGHLTCQETMPTPK